MKNKVLTAMVIAIAISPIGNSYAADMNKMAPMSKMTRTKTAIINDAAILSIVMTVDMDEIDAAKKAQTKKVSIKVNDYAKMMITHHTKNLTKDNMLAKMMKSTSVKAPEATKMYADDVAQLTKIMKLSGTDFEKAYMDMMVDGHKKVLDNLDKKFIPSAKNAELKKHLTATRATVKSHLDMATTIRKSLT